MFCYLCKYQLITLKLEYIEVHLIELTVMIHDDHVSLDFIIWKSVCDKFSFVLVQFFSCFLG